jgi:iron complex outermembrane receptor protein
VTNVASNTFLLDGTTSFKGLEGTLSADVNSQLNVSSGIQLMKAVQDPTLDLTINGLQPENTPKISGNLGLNYKPEGLKALTLSAATIYTGRRAINPQNQGFIPGVALFSAGAGYQTTIVKRRTTFQFNVNNLGNKSYWASAGGGAYGIGMERSVKMIAKINF